MVVSIKDSLKLFAVAVVTCCAVFVCTLFLCYNADLREIEELLVTDAAKILFEAQISMGKVTCAVTGCCLAATSVVLLFFYIKNYIDSHGKELGVMKALGYSEIKIAVNFIIFGLCVFIGCALGFAAAYCYMPRFYDVQNAEGFFPDVPVNFHPLILIFLVIAPSVAFGGLSVLYAYLKLKAPPLSLICGSRESKPVKKKRKESNGQTAFLKELKKSTLTGKKIFVFFIVFSAFCFSAMTQMSVSMIDLASETFSAMILIIGLILAFMILFLSLSAVVKANDKTIAMMKVFGYGFRESSSAVIGVYRPFAYMGFLIGTGYQYGLLKLVMTLVFSDVENMPEYSFDYKALFISLAVFIAVYEAALYFYALKVGKMSVKCVMEE